LLTALKKQMAKSEGKTGELRNILIYCAPSTHKQVLAAVSSLGLRCHEFVHTVSMHKRETILCQFAKGDIQALIAIHCLDEGVDIPSTQPGQYHESKRVYTTQGAHSEKVRRQDTFGRVRLRCGA
jgi:superfamily II DNA or RNA helicase